MTAIASFRYRSSRMSITLKWIPRVTSENYNIRNATAWMSTSHRVCFVTGIISNTAGQYYYNMLFLLWLHHNYSNDVNSMQN